MAGAGLTWSRSCTPTTSTVASAGNADPATHAILFELKAGERVCQTRILGTEIVFTGLTVGLLVCERFYSSFRTDGLVVRLSLLHGKMLLSKSVDLAGAACEDMSPEQLEKWRLTVGAPALHGGWNCVAVLNSLADASTCMTEFGMISGVDFGQVKACDLCCATCGAATCGVNVPGATLHGKA